MSSVCKRAAKWDYVVRVDGHLIHDVRAALEQLDQAATLPDAFALVHLLKKCSIARALPETRRLHSHISRHHSQLDRTNAFLAHALISTYASLASVQEAHLAFQAMQVDRSVTSWNLLFAALAQNGQLQKARKVFDLMPSRDSISWNSMIACYSKHSSVGDELELEAATADAWRVFRFMLLDAVPQNELTFVAVVEACSRVEEVDEIHRLVVEPSLAITTSMVTAYGRCGDAERAKAVFHGSRGRDVVLWTAMVRALAQSRQLLEMRAAFERCPLRSIVTWNVVVTGYAQAGQLDEARQLLNLIPEPDTVSWTTLATAYAQAGQCSEAVKLFCSMDLQGEQPNRVSFLALLDAVTGSIALCKAAHEEVIACRLDESIAMTTSLIAMYGRCSCVAEARKLFDSMQRRDAAAWNAMMGALVDGGLKTAALSLLEDMQRAGFRPGRVTLLHALDACSSSDDVERIKSSFVAQRLLKTGDSTLLTALAAAYARVGLVDAAAELFQAAPPGGDGSVVAWCAVVAAYARHGRWNQAAAAFSSMQLDGIRPNSVAFLCILSACSHAGMLEEGRCYFQSMASDYGEGEIVVVADHYRCIIDLLGRVGEVDPAEELLDSMPFEPGGVALTCLATACKMQNESWRGSAAVLRMDKQSRSASPYVLLSSFLRELGFL